MPNFKTKTRQFANVQVTETDEIKKIFLTYLESLRNEDFTKLYKILDKHLDYFNSIQSNLLDYKEKFKVIDEKIGNLENFETDRRKENKGKVQLSTRLLIFLLSLSVIFGGISSTTIILLLN